MKFLFDFFPLVLFFIVYKLGLGNEQAALAMVNQYLGSITSGQVAAAQAPIMLATVVGIIATVLQVAYLLVRRQKVHGMLWVSLAVITIMGGATIYFHDEDFIKWKPTILYWAFGLALVISQFVFRKNLMRNVMEEAVQLPEPIWARVGYAWMAFLFLLGALNLLMAFVVFKGDTSAWVNFKVFGMTGIFFAFVIGQTFLLFKYLPQEDA
ncbi:MAG TPA: septation protein A [Telluria sp.]